MKEINQMKVNEISQAINNATTSDAVQTKVVSMLDALQNGAVEVGHTVVKYTPDVVDAALWITRVNGIQQLVLCVFWLIAFLITFHYIKILWKWTIKLANDAGDFFPMFIFPAVGSISCLLALFKALDGLINIWIWVEVFQPKLYIAKQIVDRVLQ